MADARISTNIFNSLVSNLKSPHRPPKPLLTVSFVLFLFFVLCFEFRVIFRSIYIIFSSPSECSIFSASALLLVFKLLVYSRFLSNRVAFFKKIFYLNQITKFFVTRNAIYSSPNFFAYSILKTF